MDFKALKQLTLMAASLAASLQISAQYSLCDSPVAITFSSDYAGQIRWANGETGPETVVYASQPGPVVMAATFINEYGCESKAVTQVNVEPCADHTIYFPTSFTPDGDGTNDFFWPVYQGVEIQSLTVWNRWGEQIYNADKPWDGVYAGKTVQNDTYTYRVLYIAGGQKVHFGRVIVAL